MTHIKKMVIHGFKSFAKKTEIPFDKGINVIVGANGSGKSNISDSLCFVLGRLSIKSMRAAKAKNLLFMGSKYSKPSKEAYVELVFDNKDKTFALDNDEVALKRVVRHNGQSAYLINGEKKTRTEIIELLAHAGIDPHGFNIVLQGGIQSIVKMHPDERRKIVEEVAGISVYDLSKEKSLKELEKTEDRLKVISATLRERTAYLKNLDKERAQALRFKELEKTKKRCKASILHKKVEMKNKELSSILKGVQEKTNQRDKIKTDLESSQTELDNTSEKINQINKHIQEATGLEQDKLNNEIANLKAELEGLKVRKESYENRKSDIEKRIEEVSKNIPELEDEVSELRKKSPLMAKKAENLKKKKQELAEIEEERKKVLTVKSELNSLRERIKDRENQLGRISAESGGLLKQLEEGSENLVYASEEECLENLNSLKETLDSRKNSLKSFRNKELSNEKIISISESEIANSEKIKLDVEKLDICPLCQSKMSKEHIEHVFKECDEKIKIAKENLDKISMMLEKIKSNKSGVLSEITKIEEKISSGEIELLNQRGIKEKKSQLKQLVNTEKELKEEINSLGEKRKNLETNGSNLAEIEERYDSKILEIEEISSRTKEDTDTSILYKEREIENMRGIIKRGEKDIEEIELSVGDIFDDIKEKSEYLDEKEKQEQELSEKFNNLFKERDGLQKKIQEKNLKLSEIQGNIRQIEEQINYLKIGKAKVDAEKEALEMDLNEYPDVELIQGAINVIEERLEKVQESLQKIGLINMRAVEVYDKIKGEYDIVYEKVEVLNKEKTGILDIIAEIDKKKKREFMRTFRAINTIFTDNFSKLYSKGVAYLELENKDDIFDGGVNIAVKLAKGKYFDVTSLSGGEQTLVALSLLFAIQEHKPYHFYIFDEIDAALDKRNSERLADLLRQYMHGGQYIVITHNDAIITDSNVLYGVSMQEGISKILSLKVD